MSKKLEDLCKWTYEGFWGILTGWFRIPRERPDLPVRDGEKPTAFKPCEGWLRYARLRLWIVLAVIDGLILAGWIVLTVFFPLIGLFLLPVAFPATIVSDVIAYLAVHLRYDTTWYVMTGRSIRIRRGIWIIREQTITFENVQNIKISQGPIQRMFDYSDVVIETAGGGGGSEEQQGEQGYSMHRGVIEGIENARKVRDMILRRVERSTASGIGDDVEETLEGWSNEHIAILEEIRDASRKIKLKHAD